jgi:regulator of replication initiation timing
MSQEVAHSLTPFEKEVIRLLSENNKILIENQALMKENKALLIEANDKLRKVILNTN